MSDDERFYRDLVGPCLFFALMLLCILLIPDCSMVSGL